MVNWAKLLIFKRCCATSMGSSLDISTPHDSDVPMSQSNQQTRFHPQAQAKYVMWKDCFLSMLKDDEGFDLFRQYLVSQYCEENLDFWKAVEDFKMNSVETDVRSKAVIIYELYIKKGANRCINLRSKTRHKLCKQLESDVEKNIFQESQQEILEVMQRDPFQRFLRSEIYRNLCP